MKFRYQTLLEKSTIKEEELPAGLRKKVLEMSKVVAGIADAEEQVKDTALSVAKKAELTTLIEQSKEGLKEMDADLCEKIKKWIPNREKFAEAGKRMQQGRANKAGQHTPAAAPQTNTSTAPAAAQAQTPAPAKKPATPAKAPEEENKGMSIWGWVIGGILALGIGVGAFQIVKAYASKKAA